MGQKSRKTDEEKALRREKAALRKAAEARKKKWTAAYIAVAFAAVLALVLVLILTAGKENDPSRASESTGTESRKPAETDEPGVSETEVPETPLPTDMSERAETGEPSESASGTHATDTSESSQAFSETEAPKPTETKAPEPTAPADSYEPKRTASGVVYWSFSPMPPYNVWAYEDNIDPIPVQGGITMPSWIIQDLIPVSPINRPGTALGAVKNVVIHYVGNTASSAKANREYFRSLQDPAEANPRKASSHFVIGLEGEILQAVPINEVAYSQNERTVTYDRNTDCISIENCHPLDDGRFNGKTYASLVHLASWLLEEYGLTSEDLIRHYDVTGKSCPLYYIDDVGKGGHPDAWNAFKADVKAYMEAHPDIAHEFP